MRGACLASDYALLELSTGEAERGAQRLGPYSRFGWRHPGPAYFYLMAPLHRLSGGSSAALPVGALLINWAAVLSMAALLGRRLDRSWALLLALPLAPAYGVYLGPGFIYNIWNPAVTVLPFGLFLVSCAALASGDPRHLPVVAIVGSFLVQTHVGYVPPVAAAIAVAAGSWLYLRLSGNAPAASRAVLGLTLAALILLWALPLIEQFTHRPGNLTRIARFFLRAEDGHPLGESLAVTSREIAWPWSTILFGRRDPYAPYPALTGLPRAAAVAWTLMQTALLARWSFRRGEGSYARALARVCLACTVAAVLAVMHITGDVRPYAATWISMGGVLGPLGGVAALLPRPMDARLPPQVASGVLPAELAIVVSLAGRPLVHDSQFPPARAMSDSIVDVLRQRGAHRPQLIIQTGSPELFYAASAVLLQMHKRGTDFAVERPWWNFFEERWRPTGAEDDTLDFASSLPQVDAVILCHEEEGASMCIGIRPGRQ